MAEREESGKVVTSVFKRAVRNIRKKPKKEFIELGKPKGRFLKLPEAVHTRKLEKFIKNRPISEPKSKRGIVYLGHIPPGFYEEQIRQYFGQFGTVTRVKVARSEKTGKSRGYAYVEFQYVEVAKIVAETMNNYLMGNRLLKAELLSKRFPTTFWREIDPKQCPGRQRAKFHTDYLNRRILDNKKLKEFVQEKHYKLQKLCEKLKAKGIDFSFKLEYADIDTKISGKGKYTALDESKSPDKSGDLVLEVDESDDEIEFNESQLYDKSGDFMLEVDESDDEIEFNESQLPVKSENLVLEVDESDDEIEFNTPPNVTKKKLIPTQSGSPLIKKQIKLSKKRPVKGKKRKLAGVGLKKNVLEVPSRGLLQKKNKIRYFNQPLDREAAASS